MLVCKLEIILLIFGRLFGVAIFLTVSERNSNSNRGGSMFDRAGRGLCTPHLLCSALTVEAHCSTRAHHTENQ